MKLESASEEELLARLDRLLYGTDDQISGRELRDAVARARRWVDQWTTNNRDRFCRGVSGAIERDGVLEAATVIDIVMTTGLDQPTATVLAAILIKHGIKALCRGYISPPHTSAPPDQ